MRFPFRRFAPCCLLATLVVPPALHAQADSPFRTPSKAAPAAQPVVEHTALELRSISMVNGQYFYGLFEPATRRAIMVPLNEKVEEVLVRAHDVANDEITVEYQGRQVRLAMKQAKIESAPAVGPMPPPRPMTPGAPNPPVVINPSAADEAKRLETVAAEVRRRRMMRQAAVQQQGQPPAPPPGQSPR